MSVDEVIPDSSEPPSPFCQRCDRRIDTDTIGPQVGLGYCSICGVYACRWCWIEFAGVCPACAFPYAVAPAAGVARGGLLAATRQRGDLRAFMVGAALVVAVSMLALTIGGAFGPTGGVEGATDVPSGVTSAGSGIPQPSLSGGPTSTTETSAEPTAVPIAATPVPTGTFVTGPSGTPPGRPTPTAPSTPAPAPTPMPTPTPTPTSTPTPTPTPAPTPTPPVCVTVPSLVGLTVEDARVAWAAAGFTGSFTPARGHRTVVVQTQNQRPGACVPATTSIVVTYG